MVIGASGSPLPVTLSVVPSADSATANVPDHETLPWTIVLVNAFQVLLAALIQGGELFAPNPLGTAQT